MPEEMSNAEQAPLVADAINDAYESAAASVEMIGSLGANVSQSEKVRIARAILDTMSEKEQKLVQAIRASWKQIEAAAATRGDFKVLVGEDLKSITGVWNAIWDTKRHALILKNSPDEGIANALDSLFNAVRATKELVDGRQSVDLPAEQKAVIASQSVDAMSEMESSLDAAVRASTNLSAREVVKW
jgi:hypothetical protein